MRHIIPKLSSANAYLLFSEPTITSVYLYVLQDSQKGEASRDNAVYVVSNTDGAKRITVHRTGTIVADIQYPSQFHRRKSGSVSFPGRESMSFEQWMTGAGKSGVEHELTMGSEKYTWTESSRDESVVHPLTKGGELVATYVPGHISRNSGERIWTSAYLVPRDNFSTREGS